MALSAATSIAQAIDVENADAAVEGAVDAIEAEIGPIETEAQTLTLGGVWTHRLPLHRRPVTAVASVTVDGVLVDAGLYRFRRSGLLIKKSPIGYWGGPDVEVVAAITAGFVIGEVPGWVEQLVEDVARRAVAAADGITQESFGDYSVTYGHARDGLSKRQRSELRTKFGLGMLSLTTT